MKKGRLEAFSDGVIAIIITIMVLELKAPHSAGFEGIKPLWAVFLSYVLSYVFIGIYWSNHHHLLHTIEHVTGGILWANLHLLFWLSLVPFLTAWMGENHFAALPTACYGGVLFASALAYQLLQIVIIRAHGRASRLGTAVGRDLKGKLSGVGYLFAIPLAFVHPGISHAIYASIALLWLVPDRRIERVVGE